MLRCLLSLVLVQLAIAAPSCAPPTDMTDAAALGAYMKCLKDKCESAPDAVVVALATGSPMEGVVGSCAAAKSMATCSTDLNTMIPSLPAETFLSNVCGGECPDECTSANATTQDSTTGNTAPATTGNDPNAPVLDTEEKITAQVMKCMPKCSWLGKNMMNVQNLLSNAMASKVQDQSASEAEMKMVMDFCTACNPDSFDAVGCGLAHCGCVETDCGILLAAPMMQGQFVNLCKLTNNDLAPLFTGIKEGSEANQCSMYEVQATSGTTTTTAAPTAAPSPANADATTSDARFLAISLTSVLAMLITHV